jgi:hypothetical protein
VAVHDPPVAVLAPEDRRYPQRCGEQVLADMLFTLPPDAYYRLVHEEGWSAEEFQKWLADLLQRFCLP